MQRLGYAAETPRGIDIGASHYPPCPAIVEELALACEREPEARRSLEAVENACDAATNAIEPMAVRIRRRLACTKWLKRKALLRRKTYYTFDAMTHNQFDHCWWSCAIAIPRPELRQSALEAARKSLSESGYTIVDEFWRPSDKHS